MYVCVSIWNNDRSFIIVQHYGKKKERKKKLLCSLSLSRVYVIDFVLLLFSLSLCVLFIIGCARARSRRYIVCSLKATEENCACWLVDEEEEDGIERTRQCDRNKWPLSVFLFSLFFVFFSLAFALVASANNLIG
mgnify:FL=1